MEPKRKRSDHTDTHFYSDVVFTFIWAAAFVGFVIMLCSMASCTSLNQDPALLKPSAPSPEYRSDLTISVNGVKFPGIGVAQLAKAYQITLYPEASIDRIIWTTCNQQQVIDKPAQNFWDSITGNNTFSFTLTPDPALDSSNACALEVSVLTEHQNVTGYALIDFMDARVTYQRIKATARCNGLTTSPIGVFVCQSAQGLIQDFVFDRPVIPGTPGGQCAQPVDVDSKRTHYRLTLSAGKCLYLFGDKDGNYFRLNAIGYNEVPYRQ